MDAYFLDTLPVETPRGIDGLTLNKKRNPRWFSMLYQDIGYSNGVGGVLFFEKVAVDYLWNKLLTDGIDAQVRFQLIRDELVQYEAWVDFGTLKRSYDGISVSFRDEKGKVTLENGANQPQSLSLAASVTVPRRPLGGSAAFVPAQLTISRGGFGSSISLLVSLPLKPDNTQTPPPGLLRTVTHPVATPYETIYTNTTERDVLIRVGGLLGGTLKAAGGYVQVGLTTLLPNGGGRTQVVGGVTPSSGGVSLDMAIDSLVTVRPGESLAITLESTATLSEYVVTLTTKTRLTLSEVMAGTGMTAVPAIRVADALAALGTGLGVTLSSSYYGSGAGSSLYLTTGKALRGQDDTLTISLESLFEGLSATRCLALWNELGYWRCEPRTTYLSRATAPLRLPQVISFTIGPWNDYQYSEVKGGYKTWRGDSALSDNEPYGNRTWVRPGTTNRATLDIQSMLIASLTLIEEQVRRREETASNTAQLDNGVFLIDAADSGVLSPERGVAYWGDVYPLPALQRADENAVGEVVALASAPIFKGWQATVEAPLSLMDWTGLEDWVQFYDGAGTFWTGLVIGATWRETDNQGEVVSLSLLL